MVLIAPTNTDEDSKTRQLHVSKKLSKAISSVPRSRFQKPRPNLPGSKRTESSSTTPARKTNESSKKNDVITENSSAKESPQKEDSLRNCIVLNNDDLYKNNDALKVESDEISQKEATFKDSETIVIKEKTDNEDTQKKSTNLNSNETCQDKDIAVILENVNHVKETFFSNDVGNSLTENTESLPCLAEETSVLSSINNTDALPITTISNSFASIVDKSSKYPHLTSILSKKRTEPKKEVQHKKRKKFKKGDVAPERSKMTMADLIYWNPVNVDQNSKISKTDDEKTNNSNYDEPEECPDADVPLEENTVCDSVPKLVIAEDGSINIDQSSLVISRNIPEPTVTEVIRKDDTTYSSFRKRPMTKHWTAKDTTIFYKALSLVGTDFGLMEKFSLTELEENLN